MQESIVLLSVAKSGAFGCEGERGDVDRVRARGVELDDMQRGSGRSVVGFFLKLWELEVPD